MNVTRENLRRLILEEYESLSELQEFTSSAGGKKFKKEGQRIASAGSAIRDLGHNHTGKMRKTLYEISLFVEKLGNSLSEIDSLDEGDDSENTLPTISELKRLIKAVKSIS